MTINQLMDSLKNGFIRIIKQYHLDKSEIYIVSGTLTPEEAIGITERKDFPILTGKEVMLQAVFKNEKGQSFTNHPSVFSGTLQEICDMDIVRDEHARSLFIAGLNAVMKHLGLVENTIHCRNEEPELCAQKMEGYIAEKYGNPRIALIGYQPALLEQLSKRFNLRVLDLNPENVGHIRYGTLVEDGEKDFEEVVNQWAELILCTGSTICNGSILNFLNTDKQVLFFGTTLAGAAKILGLDRVCFCSE